MGNFKVYARGSSMHPLLFAQAEPTLLSRKNIIIPFSLRKQCLTKQGFLKSLIIYRTDVIKLIYNFDTDFT